MNQDYSRTKIAAATRKWLINIPGQRISRVDPRLLVILI
jgi:hypothetical protein